MKTLSASLEAAQKASSGLPYIDARFADFAGYAFRTRLERHYSGSEERNFHASVIAADGSLVRARVDESGTDTLYVSRVAAPDAESTFDSWTALTTDVSDVAGIAMCVSPVTGRIFLFFVRATDDVSIRRYRSDDNGATWGGLAQLFTAGDDVLNLAASVASDGNILLMWSEGNPPTIMFTRSQATAGDAWGTPAEYTVATFASVIGIAITFRGDWQVILTVITESPEFAHVMYATRRGFGANLANNTWGTLRAIAQGDAWAAPSYQRPFVTFDATCYRLFFVQALNYPNTRRSMMMTMEITRDFAEPQWTEAVPVDYSTPSSGGGNPGLSASVSATHLWLTSPDGVWSSPLPALPEANVSERVLEARVETDEEGSRVVLELDNTRGDVAALPIVQPGAMLQLTPGYRTAEGPEVPLRYSYWVDAVEVVTGARPRVIVRARDAWALAAQWRARRQLEWTAGTRAVSQIFLELAARAGLTYSNINPSTAFTTVQPAFTVSPGETGVSALRRLLGMVHDVLRVDGGELVSIGTSDADTPEYSLGGEGEHAVVETRYVRTGPPFNAVKALGQDYGEYGEGYDFDALQAQGERLQQVVNVALPSVAAGQEWAEALVRKSQLAARSEYVRLFGVHCGVEVWDVVELTDPQRGLAAAPRRVRGYAWRYEPERGRYDMTLTLGDV